MGKFLFNPITGQLDQSGGSSLTLGTTAGTACEGNDSRLSDSRTPISHASSHFTAGSDPITPADIGAAPASNIEQTAINSSLGNSTLQDDISSLDGLFGSLGTAAFVDSTTFAAASHNHAASEITSGVFDNARINFAAPPAIGSTTRNTGAFTTLNANNGTLTASAPVLDLSQTWNNAAVTFSAIRLDVTNSASGSASVLQDWRVGGASVASVRADGVFLTRGLGTGAGGVITVNSVITLAGGGNGILDLRQGTSPCTLNLYNTFTNASNHERGFMRWSSNVLQIGTEAAGTGSARNIEFQAGGATRAVITAGTGIFWVNGLVVGNIGGNPHLRVITGGDGIVALFNSAQNDFNRIQFGGTTSSFPALRRSSTTLQVRLADDSAYTTIDANHRLQGAAPATSGAAGTAGDIRHDADWIYVCTAANTWKRAAIATW